MVEYKRKVIPVTKLDCPNCVATVEKELAKLKGVSSVYINFLMQKIIIDYDPAKIDVPEIEEKIEELGYRIAYKKYESLSQKILKTFGAKEREESLRKLDDSGFEELVLLSKKPVLVLFASPNCPTCGVVRPKLRGIADKFSDQIHVYELNIAETHKWEDYNVMGVPTIIYFNKGSEAGRSTGLVEENEIESKLSEIIKTR